MTLMDLRDLLAFPSNGDNSTDTVIGGVHFNSTALKYFNYTLYSNQTLSNDSNCYLVFGMYTPPLLLSNGTFVNATTCYQPILPIGTRGRIGIIFGALFGISMMFSLINLKKHGTHFLREDKRFRIVGRRWQWYWIIVSSACAMISGFCSIDVDRDYLQDMAIILQCFFFVFMGVAALGAVWEAVRHWGSWQERQIVDRDPYGLPIDNNRSKVEFYLPLLFYLFAFMDFFMIVPRSWSAIEMQRSPAQQAALARPAATDGRFKAGAILGVIAIGITIYSLRHSLHHYHAHNRGTLNTLRHYVIKPPLKLVLGILIVSVITGYLAASAWIFDISLLKFGVNPVWPYAFGYTPGLLLVIIFNISGYIDENEDKQLIKQRATRERQADAEIGITQKPNWWSKAKGDGHLTDLERLRGLTDEVPTGRPTTRNAAQELELNDLGGDLRHSTMSASSSVNSNALPRNPRERSPNRTGDVPYRDDSTVHSPTNTDLLSPLESSHPWTISRSGSTVSDQTLASGLTGRTLASVNNGPQEIRSMLDV